MSIRTQIHAFAQMASNHIYQNTKILVHSHLRLQQRVQNQLRRDKYTLCTYKNQDHRRRKIWRHQQQSCTHCWFGYLTSQCQLQCQVHHLPHQSHQLESVEVSHPSRHGIERSFQSIGIDRCGEPIKLPSNSKHKTSDI